MKFTTGQIISAGTGKLCCSVKELYFIMNFLTGDNLFTHQLPRAFDACKSWVIEQHPWLNEINAGECTSATWREWLCNIISKYGEAFDLKPLPQQAWSSRDPLEEAVEMMGDDESRIVIIRREGPE